ncbi:MAG: aminotransferase class IV [Alphaproteobacteria bacterium]|nr:aminotransferase class IV [Alphaproteobacteria bacterium]
MASSSARFVLVDGVERPDGTAPIDVDDLGLVRGVAVFETLRTHDGALPHLDDHLDRLTASAGALQVPLPARAVLAAELHAAARAIPGEASLRLLLTHGGRRIVVARPLPAPPDRIRAVTRAWPAQTHLSGRVKHCSRAVGFAALSAAGVDEVLWVDAAGLLLEGTWSNAFAVRDGVLHTAADDGRILCGVTRARVLQAAAEHGVPVHEGATPAAGPWDELYISSSLKLLLPIVELDGAPAPGAGPVGAKLLAAVRSGFRG